jgi:hypothetical protein
MLISTPLEKLQKNSYKWQKNGVLHFNFCVQKFLPYNFSWVNLLIFQWIRTRHQILRFIIPIWIFERKMFLAHINTFTNLNAKCGRNGKKKQKRILQMCLRIPFCIHFMSGRLHFVKKGQNRNTCIQNGHQQRNFQTDMVGRFLYFPQRICIFYLEAPKPFHSVQVSTQNNRKKPVEICVIGR